MPWCLIANDSILVSGLHRWENYSPVHPVHRLRQFSANANVSCHLGVHLQVLQQRHVQQRHPSDGTRVCFSSDGLSAGAVVVPTLGLTQRTVGPLTVSMLQKLWIWLESVVIVLLTMTELLFCETCT